MLHRSSDPPGERSCAQLEDAQYQNEKNQSESQVRDTGTRAVTQELQDTRLPHPHPRHVLLPPPTRNDSQIYIFLEISPKLWALPSYYLPHPKLNSQSSLRTRSRRKNISFLPNRTLIRTNFSTICHNTILSVTLISNLTKPARWRTLSLIFSHYHSVRGQAELATLLPPAARRLSQPPAGGPSRSNPSARSGQPDLIEVPFPQTRLC